MTIDGTGLAAASRNAGLFNAGFPDGRATALVIDRVPMPLRSISSSGQRLDWIR